MPLTEDDIKKKTLKELVQTLTVGAWIWILGFYLLSLSASFGIGYKVGLFQVSPKHKAISLEMLSNQQCSLVLEIWRYQKSNKLNKVIITQEGFFFNDNNSKPTDINLKKIILGEKASKDEFEKLILSIPESFLKNIPEMRFGSPYVVMIPEPVQKLLDKEL